MKGIQERGTGSTGIKCYGVVDAGGNELAPHIPIEVHDIKLSTNFGVRVWLQGEVRNNMQCRAFKRHH